MTRINIVGAGGIGRAAAQIILSTPDLNARVLVGDRSEEALNDLIEFVGGRENDLPIETYVISNLDSAVDEVFAESDVVLDCLPGGLAPKVAAMAKKHKAHYANLTEYVQETNEILELARDADSAFVLQTGLAPGYINVLAHALFDEFCQRNNVESAESISMKVGALTRHAVSPHFYGFTWSPIGVATEYVKDAVILRDHKVIQVPALSGIESILIDGQWYEDNYTSGGAADLPQAFRDKVKNLDYKTLRYPGHYAWVRNVLNEAPYHMDRIEYLQNQMLQAIPRYDEDVVIIYASVQGWDDSGQLCVLDASLRVPGKEVGGKYLTAIQATTASALVQSAILLLDTDKRGPILQSEIDPISFLSGSIVEQIYGPYKSSATSS